MSWPVVKLGDVITSVRSLDPKIAFGSADFIYVDIGSVSQFSKAIEAPQRISSDMAPSRARQLICEHDILVSTVRPNLNAVAIVGEDFDGQIASTGFTVLRPDSKKIHPVFLFHWVRSPMFVEDMVRKASGQSYPAVSDRIVKDSPIPLPPIPEQKRIAAILDQADALRRLRAQALEKVNTLGQAIFQEMFGGVRNRQGSFKTCALGDFTEIKLGKMLDKGKFTGKQTWPYLRNANVRWFGFDLSDLREMEFSEEEMTRFSVRRGDLLICEGGEPGRCAVWRGKDGVVYYQKALHRLRIMEPVATPEFLSFWFFNAAEGGLLVESVSKATIAHLTGEKIMSLTIHLPPIKAQHEFTNRVERISRLADAPRKASKLASALFTSLQHRAFRGEL